MGDPRFQRKRYRPPKMPWRTDVLSYELEVLGKYGLRNKRELWRAQAELSRIRRQARFLLAADPKVRAEKGIALLKSLVKRGLIPSTATVDEILNLKVDDLLERRLQTIVWRRGLASTPYQARQFIVHGRIMVGDKAVKTPSYPVEIDMEPQVRLKEGSPYIQEVPAG